MLSSLRFQKLIQAIKNYRKQYLDGKITELDESGTRILINSFLSEVLGYKPIEEIKTEYMIKGTYADYVVQLDKVRYFLVEVKALSFDLSEKHLRQTINYGANEGIEYAMLTNGRVFQFYKVIFEKPISARLIFSVDLNDQTTLKTAADFLQHLHRDSVSKNEFRSLWNKCEATDTYNIAGILCSPAIVAMTRKLIKHKYNEKCDEDSILHAIQRIIVEKMDVELIKPFKAAKAKPVKQKVDKYVSPDQPNTVAIKE